MAPISNFSLNKKLAEASNEGLTLKDDFNIAVEGNMLTISSEKEENKEEKNERFTRKEYNYSSFSRSFTLPEQINREKIEAKYEDGVLKLSLPSKAQAKMPSAKQIAVK